MIEYLRYTIYQLDYYHISMYSLKKREKLKFNLKNSLIKIKLNINGIM